MRAGACVGVGGRRAEGGDGSPLLRWQHLNPRALKKGAALSAARSIVSCVLIRRGAVRAEGIASRRAEVQCSSAIAAGNLAAHSLPQRGPEPGAAPAPPRAARWLCLGGLGGARRCVYQLRDFSINLVFTFGALHSNYLNQ